MPAILVKRVSNKRYRTLDTTSGQAPESELQCHSRNLGHRRCWNGVLSWALERLEPHSSLRDGRHMHTWSHRLGAEDTPLAVRGMEGNTPSSAECSRLPAPRLSLLLRRGAYVSLVPLSRP